MTNRSRHKIRQYRGKRFCAIFLILAFLLTSGFLGIVRFPTVLAGEAAAEAGDSEASGEIEQKADGLSEEEDEEDPEEGTEEDPEEDPEQPSDEGNGDVVSKDLTLSLTMDASVQTLSSTEVLGWNADIHVKSGQVSGSLSYVNTLPAEDQSDGVTYITDYPILLTAYLSDGTESQSYYFWNSENVTRTADGRGFSILLPEGDQYSAYRVTYYTTYEPETEKTYQVQGTVKQGTETLAAETGTYVGTISKPKITASIYNDNDGISYQAAVTVPAGNQGTVFYAGGGVTVEKDEETVTIPLDLEDMRASLVTITPKNGETITLSPYKENSTSENTYQLVVDHKADIYSVDIAFNTGSGDIQKSYWSLDEEADLEVRLSISTEATDENGKTIASYLSEGYTITNHFFGDFERYGRSEGTATYSNVVQKSSDLGDFVTAINIYDENNVLQYGTSLAGNTVQNTLYVSRDYIYELYFEERNNAGDYVEMKPDESGYMTYRIPEGIHPLSDDLTPQEITLSNGKPVAEFHIESQTIKLKFYDVDENGDSTPGKSWIDSPGLKKLTLRFEGAFTSNASETIDLNITENLSIKLAVIDDTGLAVKKQAGEYDPTKHTVAYTVTVTGTGDVHNLTLTDTVASNNGKILPDSMTASIGDTALNAPQCALQEDGSYLISGLPDLERGQVLTISYLLQIDDDVAAYTQPKGSVWLKNTVTGNGISPQGHALQDTATEQKTVSVTNLAKTGYRTTDANTPVIQWTITVGDGSYDVGSQQLTDTLGDYLSIYTGKAIAIETVTKSGKVSTVSVPWSSTSVERSDTEGTFALTLPASNANDPYTLFRVRYYTTYEAQDSFNTYYNTVHMTLNGKPMGVQGSCSVAPPGNVTVVKTGERNGNYLDWTIVATLPSGLYGTRGVYLTEYCDGIVLLEDGRLSYRSADLTKAEWEISVETESGEVIEFTPYANNGITENTYTIVWGHQYTNVAEGKYNNTRGILFNCTGQNTWDSTWLIDEASTITVHMRVPITNGISGGYTAQEVLDNGGFISNIATCFVAESSKGRSTAAINGVPLHKSGTQDSENGTINYAVTLRNHDHVTDGAVMSAVQAQSMEFIDEFDERLEYVENSLKLELRNYETSGSSGGTVATFWYRGGTSGNGSLQVSADQFVSSSGQTLRDFAAKRGTGTFFNFFFTYQLRVKSAYKNSMDTALQFDNTATLRWGSSGQDSVSASSAVTYKTGLLNKSTVGAPENGETLGNGNVLKYQIELNPEELDLDPKSDVLTVLDTLPDCLSVIWDNGTQVNVVGEYWDNSVGDWVNFEASETKSWQKSYYYDKTQGQNVLKFQVPDGCHVRVTYECQVTEYGDAVKIENQVSIVGQASVHDSVESMFKVNVKSGTAESDDQQFSIIKTDSVTHAPMADVKFVLYSTESRDRTPSESGISTQITGKDGLTYYYYGEYTTDSDGYCLVQILNNDAKYILREYAAPVGYQKMTDRYLQYSLHPLEAADVAAGFENVFKNQTILVVNDPIILPNTGGEGTWIIYLAAALCVLAAGVLLLRRRKAARRSA